MDYPRAFKTKTSRVVVWSAYVFIIFEMIYMSTPFAVFFYSVYGWPLKFLSQNTATLWLTQNILPHFTQTGSVLINTLLYMSWPLMGLGLVIFIIGFCQVYWAKFRRKGPVLGGLYRYIRHPQYAAWAIFGLGIALFWSRMIVWLMYVTMLFVYYLLAVNEERECIEKYGEPYQSYLQKTGRFFPRFRKSSGAPAGASLSRRGLVAAFVMVYLIALLGTVGLGFLMRGYALSQISMISQKDTAVVSLMRMDRETMERITAIALSDARTREQLNALPGPQKRLIYIMPSSWHVSELAMEEKAYREGHHGFNPTTHMNPEVNDHNKYKVLVSKPMVDKQAEGKEILAQARGQIPVLVVNVDLMKETVSSVEKPPSRGKYGDLPVPLY